MFKHFSIALENEEEIAPVQEEQTPAETPQERETREVDEAQAVVEDGFSQIDDAAQSTQDLGRIAERLEATEQVGGASPEVVAIAEVAVENIYRTLGIKRPVGALSVESFASEKGRIKATRVAVESIKETVAEVWKKIKEFFAKMFNAIKEVFNKLFGLDKRNKQKAAELEKQFDKDVDEKLKEAYSENEEMLKDVFSAVKTGTDTAKQDLDDAVTDVEPRMASGSDTSKVRGHVVVGVSVALWNYAAFHNAANTIANNSYFFAQDMLKGDPKAVVEKFISMCSTFDSPIKDFMGAIEDKPKTFAFGHPMMVRETPNLTLVGEGISERVEYSMGGPRRMYGDFTFEEIQIGQVQKALKVIRGSLAVSGIQKTITALEKAVAQKTPSSDSELTPREAQEFISTASAAIKFLMAVVRTYTKVTADQIASLEQFVSEAKK